MIRLELLTARYPGMRRWLTQRLCALSMLFYFAVLLLRLALVTPHDFISWQHWFAPLWWRLLTLWFFICMWLHAWLGVRDVLRDYVTHQGVRLCLQWVVDLAVLSMLASAGWLMFGM